MYCSLFNSIALKNSQELDANVSCPDGCRKTCLKCLRALSKARNIVPSSFFIYLRNVTREGINPIGGGGFAVSVRFTFSQ